MVRFKNGTEDWIAFVGIYNGHPYEIFTGKIEEDSLYIPKSINKGFIIKVKEEDGQKRYDFRYQDKYGYPHVIGGISRLFDKEFWNYAKLISGVLRNGMPIVDVVNLVDGLRHRQRNDKQLAERRGTRPEAIHQGRHEDTQTEMPQLRRRVARLSGEVPALHLVRLVAL